MSLYSSFGKSLCGWCKQAQWVNTYSLKLDHSLCGAVWLAWQPPNIPTTFPGKKLGDMLFTPCNGHASMLPNCDGIFVYSRANRIVARFTSIMNHWVAGIDLGATKIAMGLISPEGRITARQRFPTAAPQGPSAAIERIAGVIETWRDVSEADIAACGVCTPGPVDHVNGVILDPPNLGWRNVAFRDMLAERLHMPIVLEHDAKASALGEFYLGAGRELNARDMVYVIIGTGVGAAIILDGQLYRGAHNSAGEVGHITINRHGEPGSSGVRGCVESFTSGPFLVQRYLERAGISSIVGFTGETVAQLAEQGDRNARAVMADAGDALAAGIATMAMLMDIDLYVIGGSVARAGDLLLEPARNAVHKYAFGSVASRIRIVATKLHEDGAILGCAWQARRELRSEN